MFTLIIWEEIPEKTTLYTIPNSEINDRLRRVMEAAHNKRVNVDDEGPAYHLGIALGQYDAEVDDSDEMKGDHSIYSHFSNDPGLPIRDTAITYVYLSGFQL